jgi:hypothetical protein
MGDKALADLVAVVDQVIELIAEEALASRGPSIDRARSRAGTGVRRS